MCVFSVLLDVENAQMILLATPVMQMVIGFLININSADVKIGISIKVKLNVRSVLQDASFANSLMHVLSAIQKTTLKLKTKYVNANLPIS
jgi:hypothetical protein